MRRYAAAAVLSSLACLLFCTAPLLARPTRTITPASRKFAPAPASPDSSRSRATRSTRTLAAAHTPARPRRSAASPSHSRSAPASKRTRTAAASRHTPAARPTRAQARALDRERALASQSAVAAAERGSHSKAKPQPAPDRPQRATHFTPPQAPSNSASDSSPDVNPSALTNVGGALRPAVPGALPLKSIEEEAATPVLLPPLRVSSLYDSRGRLIVPKPLYGTHEILVHQNEMADRDGSDRVRDDATLLDLRRQKKLVALPENEALHVDERLPEDRRYSRPWTAAFLTVLASDYFAAFHSALQVDSAVRTIAVQKRLVRTNGNAAPITGETASPHLTGQAVDIAKGGLSRTQIAWLRTYLQPLITQNKIDVEEEFQQACFHISVYKNFLPIAPGHTIAAASRQLTTDTLPERPSE